MYDSVFLDYVLLLCCCHIQIANMIGVYRLENKYFTNITSNNFAKCPARDVLAARRSKAKFKN